MPEHYTRNILEVTAWCRKCQKRTQHLVYEGRQRRCIDTDHGNRFRTVHGIYQFRVVWLDLATKTKKHKDFADFYEATTFYQSKGPSIATLWLSSKTPEQLR